MKHITCLNSLVAATLALGTLATATIAHARNDVGLSVTVGTPAHAQRAPAYVQPRHGYAPAAPAYTHHRPDYAQPSRGHGWGHQHHYQHGHHMNAHGPRGDLDRDGIPNRYDRFPRNPNRR